MRVPHGIASGYGCRSGSSLVAAGLLNRRAVRFAFVRRLHPLISDLGARVPSRRGRRRGDANGVQMAHGCNLLTVRRGTSLEPAADDSFPEIDGASTEIRTLKQHMLSVARDPDVTVLIVGESGTGKERVARAIHRLSPRSHAPFVVVDCASLSATLVEDELFGHVRGAFTGAIRDQAGPFERARGGTVLLDEVGDLTPDLQMKLLRALQARTVQRLGGGSETTFDVRVIASTNVDLAVARARGRFREDLYLSAQRVRSDGAATPHPRRQGREGIGRRDPVTPGRTPQAAGADNRSRSIGAVDSISVAGQRARARECSRTDGGRGRSRVDADALSLATRFRRARLSGRLGPPGTAACGRNHHSLGKKWFETRAHRR